MAEGLSPIERWDLSGMKLVLSTQLLSQQPLLAIPLGTEKLCFVNTCI